MIFNEITKKQNYRIVKSCFINLDSKVCKDNTDFSVGVRLQMGFQLFRCYLYESLWTLLTALPDGSIIFLNDASQAIASGVLHATDGTEGTHNAAESDGKCSLNIDL
jgi:hypothetical protein